MSRGAVGSLSPMRRARAVSTPGQSGLGTSFHLATNGQQETDGRQPLPVYGKMQRRGVEPRWVLGGRCGER